MPLAYSQGTVTGCRPWPASHSDTQGSLKFGSRSYWCMGSSTFLGSLFKEWSVLAPDCHEATSVENLILATLAGRPCKNQKFNLSVAGPWSWLRSRPSLPSPLGVWVGCRLRPLSCNSPLHAGSFCYLDLGCLEWLRWLGWEQAKSLWGWRGVNRWRSIVASLQLVIRINNCMWGEGLQQL